VYLCCKYVAANEPSSTKDVIPSANNVGSKVIADSVEVVDVQLQTLKTPKTKVNKPTANDKASEAESKFCFGPTWNL